MARPYPSLFAVALILLLVGTQTEASIRVLYLDQTENNVPYRDYLTNVLPQIHSSQLLTIIGQNKYQHTENLFRKFIATRSSWQYVRVQEGYRPQAVSFRIFEYYTKEDYPSNPITLTGAYYAPKGKIPIDMTEYAYKSGADNQVTALLPLRSFEKQLKTELIRVGTNPNYQTSIKELRSEGGSLYLNQPPGYRVSPGSLSLDRVFLLDVWTDEESCHLTFTKDAIKIKIKDYELNPVRLQKGGVVGYARKCLLGKQTSQEKKAAEEAWAREEKIRKASAKDSQFLTLCNGGQCKTYVFPAPEETRTDNFLISSYDLSVPATQMKRNDQLVSRGLLTNIISPRQIT